MKKLSLIIALGCALIACPALADIYNPIEPPRPIEPPPQDPIALDNCLRGAQNTYQADKQACKDLLEGPTDPFEFDFGNFRMQPMSVPGGKACDDEAYDKCAMATEVCWMQFGGSGTPPWTSIPGLPPFGNPWCMLTAPIQ